ncbi:MAG: RraA family protein [Bryobacterales bacterium]|jgi:4-hydroxy-4-methyl-2-oxoglutarate aldolase|nr:RraA family protein [Bryobacterales bacterium]
MTDLLDRLRRFDTPTIANVIELFEVRPRTEGYMDSRIRACFPEMPPMVGYASTATIRCAFPRRDGDVYRSLDDQLQAFGSLPGPAVVVFQDLDDPSAAATFGEIMCTTYQAFGAAGLITSGTARDLDQVRRIGFPAFSAGINCSHGYSHVVDVHVPVRVGGLAVHPGMLLHGDANGVTSIPDEIAADVAGAADEYVAAEGVILDFLKAGSKDVAGFSAARNEAQSRMKTLSERVRMRGRASG